MRIILIRNFILVLFLMIAGNLLYTQLIRWGYYYDLSVNNHIRVIPMEAPRGRILDRDGRILADSRMSFRVSVVPQDIDDKDRLFAFLAGALNEDRETLLKRYRQQFVNSFTPVVVDDDVDRRTAIVMEENRFLFPEVVVEESYGRWYPGYRVGAHVLGYVGQANRADMDELRAYGLSPQNLVGKTGVEEYYDNYLRGVNGGRTIEVNNRGQQVRLLSWRNPSRGKDLQLTVDQRLQEAAAQLLGEARGAIVVMDASDGQILGIVSSPSFDPNAFVDKQQRFKVAGYVQNAASPLLNRAVTGQFPPGSVFKLVTASSSLETGKSTPHSTFDCPGYYTLGHTQFGCTHVHGPQDLREALAHSCNVYFYHLGLLVGVDDLSRYAKLLGLGSPTRIDLPYEGAGYVPDKKSRRKARWYTGDTLNISIGQGDVLATPLQLARLVSVIANDGAVVRPHLIYAVDGARIEQDPVVGRVPLASSTIDAIREGLRSAITDPAGTANVLDTPGLTTYGKTGTAQAGSQQPSHAWFAGYTVSGKKKIAFCVFLEHGGSSHNACLLARGLLLSMQSLGIL